MDYIISALSNYQIYMLLGLTLFVIILLFIIIIQAKSISSLEKRYRKFMRGVNNKNLEELIINYLDKIDEVKVNSDKLREDFNVLDSRVKGCVQKLSIIRYRAFDNVGSDLSFSLALLDDNNNGTILTGIYGRNESITYAKPIDKGISRYDLSEEEKEVLEEAINKN
jgi:hypothetical protein